MTYFNTLPYELKGIIFGFLSPGDLWSCMNVCREWWHIINKDIFWKKKICESSIDHNFIRIDEIQTQILCKYAALWRIVNRSCNGWSSNAFHQHTIQFTVSEESECRRIFVFYNKVAILGKVLTIYSFLSKKKFTKETISLPFVPHNVAMNNKYVSCTSFNLLSLLVIRKDKSKVIISLKNNHLTQSLEKGSKTNTLSRDQLVISSSDYIKAEVVADDYLWYVLKHSESYYCHVLNLITFEKKVFQVPNFKFIHVLRQKVLIPTKNFVLIFGFNGGFLSKIEVSFENLQSTDNYLLGIVQNLETDKKSFLVWNLGRNCKSQTFSNAIQSISKIFYFYRLDHKRHLLYGCDNDNNKCKVTAIDFRNDVTVWCQTLDGLRSTDIEEMYVVCDKFLILDTYHPTTEPLNHYGYVFDLDKNGKYYKILLSGYTMFVSNNLWVLKRQNTVTVNVY